MKKFRPSKRCKSCIYRATTQVPWACEYILIKGHMRNCEPGSLCTKYKKGDRVLTDTSMQIPSRTDEVESYLNFLDSRHN